jgi:hypothetical protein
LGSVPIDPAAVPRTIRAPHRDERDAVADLQHRFRDEGLLSIC